MALRRTLSNRLFKPPIEPPPTLKSKILPNPANSLFHRKLLTSPEPQNSGDFGILRRFFHSQIFLPLGEKLREKLSFSGDRLRLDGLSPPVNPTVNSPVSFPARVGGGFGEFTVDEAKKVLKSAQLERVRSVLRGIHANSVTYSEYVSICIEACSSTELGEEFAKRLDESGNVIVLGNVVFLRPDQVAKSMEKLISDSIAIPNDPRRRELEQLENQKAYIDRKAQKQVQAELYCGLGFLALQTLGFMRLTFWELSWDVMEPICFFVTSFHFAIAYGFFLRTSKEPTFEGFFKRRLKTKQKKLMEIYSFDLEKYDRLCKAFYPNYRIQKKCEFFGVGIW